MEVFRRFRDGYAERGVTVQNIDPCLGFGDLTVEVPCDEPSAQQLHANHRLPGKALRSHVTI